MQLTIMSAAEQQLADLYSAGMSTKLNGFRVAGTANATLNKDANGPLGPLLYSGVPSQIKYIPVSEHEVVFIAYLDDTVGGFSLGNLMFYLDPPNGSNTPTPFLWAALPSSSDKNADDFPHYEVGNIVMVHCACWFPYITEILDFSNLELFVAQFPSYANERVAPNPAASEYEQITIDTHTLYNAATMVVRDNLRLKWNGLAFSQSIDDPNLGQITGGIMGQGYGSDDTLDYVSGGTYLQDNSDFVLADGGTVWALPDEPAIIGGSY